MRVEINLDKVKTKLDSKNIQRGQYALANQALADMNPFIPMNEGILRQGATIDIDGSAINYNAPYAAPQFRGYRTTKKGKKVFFSDYTTPGTGPRWDLKGKGLFMSDWIKAFTKGADW